MTRIGDPLDRLRAASGLLAGAALALLAAAPVSAQSPVDFAPDITAPLGTGPALVVADQQLAHDDAAGGVTGFLILPGTLPGNVEVAGYHHLASGNVLLSVDTTTALPGLPPGAPAAPNDVVEFAPGTGLFSVYFDGAAAGVPANARIDALGANAALDPLLSFDTTVTLPAVGAVDDEDVVSFAAGLFAMVYDGSAAGIGSALDLDGFQPIGFPAGWLLSFDTTGSVGALTFDDEDVLIYDIGLATYAMYFDASLSDPVNWPAADLTALPEPGTLPGLAAGAVLLAACGRRRRDLTTAPGSPSRRAARSTASPPGAGSCTG